MRLGLRDGRFVAERVTVGNPPWTAQGHLAEVGRLTVVLTWSPFAIESLELEQAALHLRRDAAGYANWYWRPPGNLPGKGLGVIRALHAPAGVQLTLADQKRDLSFEGTLQVDDGARALQLEAAGRLNTRKVAVSVEGDPLAKVARDKPWHFRFEERSSGSVLSGQATLPQPFNFGELDRGVFAAAGIDLADLYYLVGLRFPDTGPYKASGKLVRHGLSIELRELWMSSGESDIGGSVSVQIGQHDSLTDLKLHSRRLRLADVGEKAAGRAAPDTAAPPLLIPDRAIRVTGLRRGHYTATYHAQELIAGPVTLHSVAGKVTNDHGVVRISALTGTLPEGKVSAQADFDAVPATPTASLRLEFSGLQLGSWYRKDPQHPPIEGLLEGSLRLTGKGHSLHELAATANGAVTLTLPSGRMRASLAELTGVDLRGLGLLITHNKEDTSIRCGEARLRAHDGILTAETLVLDTDRMIIAGSGTLRLDTESPDLLVHGQPKERRLFRLNKPVRIQGTLRHPSVSIETRAGSPSQVSTACDAQPDPKDENPVATARDGVPLSPEP